MLERPPRSRQELAATLRDAGLRVTGPRVAVLATVFETPHLDVDAIAVAVRGGDLGRVSTQAVYDVLRALVAAGLVRRLEPAGSPARYEARVGDNHHHLVCRDCGRVVDVDCATGSAPCLEPSDAAGFAVDEAEVTYWGRCPDCAGTEADLRDSLHTKDSLNTKHFESTTDIGNTDATITKETL